MFTAKLIGSLIRGSTSGLFSVTIVLAQELLPRHIGIASGLILGLAFGTGGLGTALSGYLADKLGLYNTVWFLALVPLLGAILVFFIKTKPEDRQMTLAR